MKGRRENADSGHVIEIEQMTVLGGMIVRTSIRRDGMRTATDRIREAMIAIDRIPEATIVIGRIPEEIMTATDRIPVGRTTGMRGRGIGTCIAANERLRGIESTIEPGVLLLLLHLLRDLPRRHLQHPLLLPPKPLHPQNP